MPYLDKACFTLELRTGSEYIGWFGAVIAGLNFLINLYEFTVPYHVGSYIMFNLIISISQCAISVFLIKGAKDSERKMLIPWLVGTVINLGLINLLRLVLAFKDPIVAPYIILGLFVSDSIGAYLWFCVYSFYQSLVETPIPKDEHFVIEDAGTTSV